MKINVLLCVLVACLLSGCECVFSHGDANTTYKWTYSHDNGTTSSGEFTTNEYGQATFDVPEDTECNKLEVKRKDSPPVEEDAQ